LAVVILLLGFGALGLYFRTYIKSTVSESIRHQFEVERDKMREEFEREIHTINRKDKFKLAALDKRLEAHQCAYTLAIKMNQTLGQPNEGKEVVQKCKTFWEEQNLFLSNEIRKLFQDSFFFYQEYHYRLRNADKHEQKIRDGLLNKIESSEDKLRNLPFITEQAVNLEPIAIKEQLIDEQHS
jgi:hypothetical protein